MDGKIATKATGAKLKIIVYWGKYVEKVEILDTADIFDLRAGIKAKFERKLGLYDPSELLVRTKDTTGKLRTLDNVAATLADELDGKFDVYLEVPPQQPAGKKRHFEPTMEVLLHTAAFSLVELPRVPTTRSEDTKVDVAAGDRKSFVVGVAVDPEKHFYYKRHYLDNLVRKLRVTDVSVVHAHRQAGKTTFVHQQLNDGRAWIFALDLLTGQDFEKMTTLSRLEKSARPSMVIVDEARVAEEHDFMKRLRGQCQAAQIPLIAVGTFATIALLGSEGNSAGLYSPITTNSIHQLSALSLDETKEFFDQAKLECGLNLGRGVVEAIHSMSGGNVGFLGMVGHYLETQGWSGKPFLITDYYRAFNKDLRTLLLGSCGTVLDELVDRHPNLVPHLCYASRFTARDVGDSLGALLAAGVLVMLEGSSETSSPHLPPVDDTRRYIVASPLYRHYLSSKMAGFLSETRLSHTWPSAQSLESILSAFDVASLAAYASDSKHVYQSQFARAVAQRDPSMELLSEMQSGGGPMRAVFLLGADDHRHVIGLLLGTSSEESCCVVEHAQRVFIYQGALGAKTACLICFCDRAPSSLATFREVAVFYAWPPDKQFSAFHLACPKI